MSAILTKALDKDRNEVSIESVKPGKKCNCFCPICGSPLIAKNRVPEDLAKREHHFAHLRGCVCEATDETVLHKWAKDIVLEEKAIMLPTEGTGNKISGIVKFASVEAEKWNAEFGFKPDLDCITEDGKRIFIEFYVSHKVTAKKRNIIVKNNLNCIEVDLNYVQLEKNALQSFLLEDSSDRQWISISEKKKYSEGYSFSVRNAWHEKAIEYLKDLFEKKDIIIGRHKIYKLSDYEYDICEQNNRYRNFRADLISYRGQKENKAFIAISFRARKRKEKHKTPRGLRVIDVIIRNENDFNRLIEKQNLCEEPGFIIYEGFNFKN